MKATRKKAKEILEKATLTEYNELIEEARLSNRQKYILFKKATDKLKNFQIAMQLEVSPETIRDDLQDVYDRVWRVVNI